MVKTYKSAIDLWLVVILIGAPLAIIFTGVSIGFGLHLLHWHENLGRNAGFLLVALGVSIGALICSFTFPCRYTLKETELYIQCGMLNWTVPYQDIRQLELSCSLWSAPALSLNRVKIVLEDGFLLISPKNRLAFIAELQGHLGHGP